MVSPSSGAEHRRRAGPRARCRSRRGSPTSSPRAWAASRPERRPACEARRPHERASCLENRGEAVRGVRLAGASRRVAGERAMGHRIPGVRAVGAWSRTCSAGMQVAQSNSPTNEGQMSRSAWCFALATGMACVGRISRVDAGSDAGEDDDEGASSSMRGRPRRSTRSSRSGSPRTRRNSAVGAAHRAAVPRGDPWAVGGEAKRVSTPIPSTATRRTGSECPRASCRCSPRRRGRHVARRVGPGVHGALRPHHAIRFRHCLCGRSCGVRRHAHLVHAAVG